MLQVPTAGMIAVLLYGSHRALGGGISIGEFAAFYTYVLLLVEPAGRIAYWMVVVQNAIAGAGGLDEILRHQPEPPNGSRLRPSLSRRSMPRSGIQMPASPSRASTSRSSPGPRSPWFA
jgi:ABC-type bacteriocin/lantibiotic exporter with double-glycine peptidase domain